MLFDILRNICSLGDVQQFTNFGILVPLQPRILAVIESCQSIANHFQRFRTFTNANQLTGLHRVRRDVYHLTIYRDVSVANELASSSACRSNTQTINNVIETSLQVLQKHLTSNTTGAGSFLKHITELFL